MPSNITIDQELYNKVVERARPENMTPDEWLCETAKLRLKREEAVERLRRFAKTNQREMAVLGVKPSDVEQEITNQRLGR
jgi:hypothetical protein